MKSLHHIFICRLTGITAHLFVALSQLIHSVSLPYHPQAVNSAVAGANIAATDNDVSLGDVLTYVMDTSTPGSANFWLDTSGATPVLRWRFSIDREAIAGPIYYNLSEY